VSAPTSKNVRTESDPPDPGNGSERRWQALAVCLVAAFMTLLDVSIVNVALPSIRSGLNASTDGLQWILSGYAVTFGLTLVPAGRLGDARSRRAVFMIGLALFTLASAAAGIAQTTLWLVIARLGQGVASGVLNPQISGLIQTLFRGRERGRAFGALGSTIGLATAAGPIIGGALIALAGPADGWRWVFYVNVPVGLIALPLAWRLLPPPGERRRRESLDPVGVALLGIGVVALLLPFVQDQQWHGSGKWLLLPVAAIVLGLFLGWERRHREPLMDLSLFRHRSYALGAAIALLYFAGFTSIFFIFTLYLQNGLHYSALLAGVAITPFALASATGATLGGRLISRFGRSLIAAGLVLVAVGVSATFLAVRAVPGHDAALATALPLLVGGLGSGLVISPNQALTLSEVPPEGGGSAGGVLQTGQRIGSAVGVAATGAVFFAAVAGTHGDWAASFRRGLIVVTSFVLIALCAAAADLIAGRRSRIGGAEPG
jgi:EmrB/QacA subfamily drug resistance transporter